MAKTVFRFNEIKPNSDKIVLDLSKKFQVEEEPEEIEDVPEYEGPTADDLRREAEAFKQSWEIEKQKMFDDAQEIANRVKKQAEEAAFEEVKRKTAQAQVIKQNAEDEAAKIIADAEEKAKAILANANESTEAQRKDGYKAGFSKGQEEGFVSGNAEANRLVDRLHKLLENTMDKRAEILSETEQQVVNLVLLMTRKVVNVISENQKNVVISTVVQALRKVKGRGDITIRVNLADLKLTTQHISDFQKVVENVKNISIIDDTTVDQGGCVIETDFGEINARISDQLNEIEQRILDVSPIRSRAKTVATD